MPTRARGAAQTTTPTHGCASLDTRIGVMNHDVKLADGTWLAGDRTDGTTRDWLVTEFNVADVRWLKLE